MLLQNQLVPYVEDRQSLLMPDDNGNSIGCHSRKICQAISAQTHIVAAVHNFVVWGLLETQPPPSLSNPEAHERPCGITPRVHLPTMENDV